MLEFAPLLVLYLQFVPYSLRPPAFVLGAEVAFCVFYVLWHCMCVTIAAVFGAVFATGEITFLFLFFLFVAAL